MLDEIVVVELEERDEGRFIGAAKAGRENQGRG